MSEVTNVNSEPREPTPSSLERKVQVVSHIWQEALTLPIPGPTDSPEIEQQETDIFSDWRKRAFDSVTPDIVDKFNRYKQLQSIDENSGSYDHAQERNEILADTDVQFLLFVDKVATNAHAKRTEIRETFRKLGSSHKTPSAYEDEAPFGHLLQGSIDKIMPLRYSIGVIVSSQEAWTQLVSKFRNGERAKAFFLPKSIYSYGDANAFPHERIPETPFSRARRSLAEAMEFEEDLHALMDGAIPREEYLTLEDDIRIYNQIGPLQKKIKPKILHKIHSLPDMYHDEFVMDILENRESYDFDLDQIMVLDERVLELIDTLKTENIADSSEFIDALSGVDALELNMRIHSLYTRIKSQEPKRWWELTAALTICPPSRIAEVDALVSSWEKKFTVA